MKENTIEQRLIAVETYLLGEGLKQCGHCGAWIERPIKLQGMGRCFACSLALLHKMRDVDGREWNVFIDVATRRDAFLELADAAMRQGPVFARAANEAIAAVDEEWVSTSWTAARLTVSAPF